MRGMHTVPLVCLSPGVVFSPTVQRHGGEAWACHCIPEDTSRLAVMEAAYIYMMICFQQRFDRHRANLVGNPRRVFPEEHKRKALKHYKGMRYG